MTRAFIAILLDEAIRAAVDAEIEQLRPLGRAVAWVPAENLHVTLKFLGQQSDAGLREATLALEDAAGRYAPFSIRLHGVGGFPGMDRPRIVWIGVAEGALEARAVQSALDAALEGRGFPRESRPWHPHLTIGRVFDPRRWRADASPALRERIARAATTSFGALSIDRIALMRSDLSRSGARYSEISSVRLGAE